MNKLLIFFYKILLINALTFGGGFVIISMIKKTFVDELGWLSDDEMLDISAIAQCCCGPLAFNTSILVGYRLFKIKGIILAIVASIIPAMVIIGLIYPIYDLVKENYMFKTVLEYIKLGVCAILIDVTLNLGKNIFKTKRLLLIMMLVIGLVLKISLGIDVLVIISLCIMIGLIDYVRLKKC